MDPDPDPGGPKTGILHDPQDCSKVIAVLRILMFLDFPDPDPLVRGMDPDPSIIMQK
jgi:hypothetical protein